MYFLVLLMLVDNMMLQITADKSNALRETMLSNSRSRDYASKYSGKFDNDYLPEELESSSQLVPMRSWRQMNHPVIENINSWIIVHPMRTEYFRVILL